MRRSSGYAETSAPLTWFIDAPRHYRLHRLVLVRFIDFVALSIAASIARCWHWIADTPALVHHPAIVLAQVNMMLRGVAFMSSSR